jgi:Na+/H+ antiporter NhaD/arsenite permease-like protein
MVLALILFIATYLALLIFSKYRVYIALASAAIYVILGILPVGNVLGSVDWNVIMMIAGTMGLTFFFIESKMPSLLADMIIGRIYSVKWIIIVLSLFAGIISAFVDNVATVLMIAPVALTISKKLNISPVNSIIAIAVSSNLQGAATLVGDTTSILLGTYANLDFLDFFVYRGRPGLFWVVEISAIIAAIVLLIVFRNEKQKVQLQDRTLVTDYFPTFILVGTIVLLILASFIQAKPEATNGFICMGMFIISLLRAIIKHKSFIIVKEAFKSIDYFTIGLLAGLFIVIAGITEAGVVDVIAALFVRISGNNIFLMYSLLVWASVLLSAFIDNIPYIATMLPVVTGIASIMNADPTLLCFGLLSGATLGGNLTPIGASANITGLGILRKEGYEVSAGRFMKISVPFTLSAVISGYLLVWLIWSR